MDFSFARYQEIVLPAIQKYAQAQANKLIQHIVNQFKPTKGISKISNWQNCNHYQNS